MIRFAALTPSLAQPGGAERTTLLQVRYGDPTRMQSTGIALLARCGLDAGLGRELLCHTVIHSCVPQAQVYWYRAPLIHTVHPTFNAAVRHVCERANVLIAWGALGLGDYVEGVKIPVVCVSHSPIPNPTPITGITHLVAVSEVAKKYFATSPGVDGLPVSVIPNGVEVERACPRYGRAWQRAQWGVSTEDKVLLFLGRQAPFKNPWASVQALAKLPANYKLIMVGNQAFIQDKPLERLVTLVDQLGLQDRVKFFPPAAFVGDILAGADCLLHLSLHEADSLVVKEAFLAGLPVVYTPAGSLPAMEKEFGVVGWPVSFQTWPLGPDSVDPDEVADQVKLIFSGFESVKFVTDKMRAVAWDRWTGPAMCARWADYLEGVVAG